MLRPRLRKPQPSAKQPLINRSESRRNARTLLNIRARIAKAKAPTRIAAAGHRIFARFNHKLRKKTWKKVKLNDQETTITTLVEKLVNTWKATRSMSIGEPRLEYILMRVYAQKPTNWERSPHGNSPNNEDGKKSGGPDRYKWTLMWHRTILAHKPIKTMPDETSDSDSDDSKTLPQKEQITTKKTPTGQPQSQQSPLLSVEKKVPEEIPDWKVILTEWRKWLE
ncbi:hypothetical protein ABW21_db0207456 [Orbilia brochopaga]|nr:hypothetical protein ABW21_db0207456 [Drechslerella brochopaga]